MPPIKHTQLFDFPAYSTAIKEVKELTVEFGKSTENVIKRLSDQQKELLSTLRGVEAVLKSLNVTQAGSTTTLKTYATQIDETTQKSKELKLVQQGLASVVDLTKASVQELEAEYKGLVSQLKQLNPAQKNYQEETARIQSRMKEVVPAINAFGVAVKNTKRSVDEAEGSYKKMQTELGNLRNQLRSLPGAFDPVTGRLNTANKTAVDLSRSIKTLDGTLKNADKEMGIYVRNVGNYQSALSGLGSTLARGVGALIGISSAFDAFKFAFDANRKIDALNYSLKAVTQTADEFARSQRFLSESAEKYGLDLIGLTESYKLFFAASTAAGISAQQAKQIFDQVSNAAANLKLSTENVNGIFFAFQQILSKGVVNAEEVRRQLGDRLPAAFSIAARSIGVTEAELNKLLETGTLTAEEFLPKFAAELEKTFGKTEKVDSLNASINRFWNNLNYGVQGEGFTQLLIDIVDLSGKAVAGIAILAGEIREMFDFDGSLLEKKFNDRVKKERDQGIAGRIESFKQETDILKKQRDLEAQKARVFELSVGLGKARKEDTKEYFRETLKLEKEVLDGFQAIASLAKPDVKPFKKKENEKKGRSADDILKTSIRKQQEIIEKASELEIKTLELRAAKKLIDEEQFQESKLTIIKTYTDKNISLEGRLGKNSDEGRIIDLQKKFKDAELEYTKFIEAQQESRRRAIDIADKDIDEAFTEQIKKEEADKVKATKTEFERKIKSNELAFDVLRNGRDTNFAEELRFLESKAKIAEEYAAKGVDTTEEAEKAKFAIKKLYAERDRELQLELQQLGFDALQTGLSIVQEQLNARGEAKISQLEAEKEKELALAGNNVAAKEKIEKEYQQRIAKEKRKQAQADKQFALFSVAINTGQAIAKTFAVWGWPAGIPFAAIALAQGALQAAAIAARPIPAFRKGTKNAPAGLAVVGEEGPELIERNGKMSLSPGRPTLTYLKGGEKIHTAKRSTEILGDVLRNEEIKKLAMQGSIHETLAIELRKGKEAEAINLMARSIQMSRSITKEEMREVMTDSMKNLPIEKVIMDERGITRRREELQSKQTYLNNRYSL